MLANKLSTAAYPASQTHVPYAPQEQAYRSASNIQNKNSSPRFLFGTDTPPRNTPAQRSPQVTTGELSALLSTLERVLGLLKNMLKSDPPNPPASITVPTPAPTPSPAPAPAPLPAPAVVPTPVPEPKVTVPATPHAEFLSSKSIGEKPADIWKGLVAVYESYPWMGSKDHDDYVAVIKVAMSTLGQSPLSVFKEVSPVAGGYNITMKDNFKLYITNDELRQASQRAKFAGTDEGMLKDARFLFATMMKRRQVDFDTKEGNKNYAAQLIGEDFGAALSTANDGISGLAGLELLGLQYNLDHRFSQDVGDEIAVPAMKRFGIKRGMITQNSMDYYGHKIAAPRGIEVLTVIP